MLSHVYVYILCHTLPHFFITIVTRSFSMIDFYREENIGTVHGTENYTFGSHAGKLV